MSERRLVGGNQEERVLYWKLCDETDKAFCDYQLLQTNDALQKYLTARKAEEVMAAHLNRLKQS